MAEQIFILGAGNVGSALGLAWLKAGHDVQWGVPDPTSSKYAQLPQERLRLARERQRAAIVVLALPYAAVKPALEALGDLRGGIVIDCTNPLIMGPDGLQLQCGHDTSGAEAIAKLLPNSAVFKTLNQTGAENMADAHAYVPKPAMFVAGDDQQHKPIVLRLVDDLGFESIDAGPLIAARLLEPLAMLWIELAMKRGHARGFAFAMLKHPDSSAGAALES